MPKVSPSLELISGGAERRPTEETEEFAERFSQTIMMEGGERLLERLQQMKYQYLGAVHESDRDIGGCPPQARRGERDFRYCVGAMIDPVNEQLAVVRYNEENDPNSARAWQVAYYDFSTGRYDTVSVVDARFSEESAVLEVTNMTRRMDRGNMHLQFAIDEGGHLHDMGLTAPKYYGRGVGQAPEEADIGQYTVSFDDFYDVLTMKLYEQELAHQPQSLSLGGVAVGYQLAS